MKKESEIETEIPGAPRRMSRTGKIARLPRAVRDELNRRLLDGEPGPRLVKWLNTLPEVKAVLQRDFGGCPVTKQNLSEWRHGGFRDGVAKIEAAEWLDDTLAESQELKAKSERRACASRRNGPRGKEVEVESVTDRVAGWFFPHYVAAARGQLAAAGNPGERWSVLRTICADLAGLRRNDHYVERLRIWQEKLRLETKVAMAEEKELTEKEVVKWVKAHPGVEQKIWPDREWLTPEECEQCANEILGISKPVDITEPGNGPLDTPVEEPGAAG